MEFSIKEITGNSDNNIKDMIIEFYNCHINLVERNNAIAIHDAEDTLLEWLKKDKVYSICLDGNSIGFVHLSQKGPSVALLEDMFIAEEYRRKGFGKTTISLLGEKIREMGKQSLCVNVVTRNSAALEFYEACGFNHLNMIELRKNFDPDDDRDREVELLGHRYRL